MMVSVWCDVLCMKDSLWYVVGGVGVVCEGQCLCGGWYRVVTAWCEV